MKGRQVVAVGAVAGALAGIAFAFLWGGHDETRTTVMANATLLVILAGTVLVLIPRLTRDKIMAHKLRRGAAMALALAGVVMIGVGVTASAPRPVIAYVVIGGGLMLVFASGALWVSARRPSA